MSGRRLEQQLAAFSAGLSWADLPGPVRQQVIAVWSDAVANALAGRAAAATPVVERLLRDLAGDGDATVIGGAPASPTAAAFLNGFQITALTMCDVYRPALCHVTPEVVPAVLAVAETEGRTGRELAEAVAVGLEVTTRLGLALDYPRFRARGWHAPGVIGTMGAAAAAARLLGLDATGVARAIGLAGSQASGTFAAFGTPAVKFHQARGAVSALWAARFAAEGLGGSERVLTHPDGGLLTAMADGGTPERGLAGLGETWVLEQISLRRWPASSSLQSLVDVLAELTADAGAPDPGDLDRVQVGLPPAGHRMCAGMGWDDELTAMQSARWVAAVVLHDRGYGVAQFAAGRRADPAVAGFAAERVRVEVAEELPVAGVRVRLVRRDGGEIDVVRHGACGDPDRPLTAEQLRAKLTEAAAAAGGSAPPDLVAAMLAGVTELPDLDALRAALTRRTEVPRG